MNNCLIEITFKFVELRNAAMTVQVEADQNTVNISNINGRGVYRQQIHLPSKVTLHFSGKNEGSDTVINADGSILVDKHILIESIRLDNMPVDQLFLSKCLTLYANNGAIVNSNYIGLNGTITLTLTKDNTFNQVLHYKSLGEA